MNRSRWKRRSANDLDPRWRSPRVHRGLRFFPALRKLSTILVALRWENRRMTIRNQAAGATRSNRRQVLRLLARLGVGSAVFQRALAAEAQQTGTVTTEMIHQA